MFRRLSLYIVLVGMTLCLSAQAAEQVYNCSGNYRVTVDTNSLKISVADLVSLDKPVFDGYAVRESYHSSSTSLVRYALGGFQLEVPGIGNERPALTEPNQFPYMAKRLSCDRIH